MSLSFDDKWGQFGGADVISADLSFNIPRTSALVPTNAIQSMGAVADGSDAMGPWGGFFANLLQGTVQYAITKDLAETRNEFQIQQTVAQQSAVAQQLAAQQAAAQPKLSGLVMLALGAGVVFLVVKAAD